MKKSTLHFGEFKQYDKVFLTADKGIDVENVLDVAFDEETLYIAQADGLLEYADGNVKKIGVKASKLFAKEGNLFAAVKNSLVEIKKGKTKKIADFDAPVVDISVALDGSMWLITEKSLYLKGDDGFTEIVDVPDETVCLAARDNKSKYGETVYVGSLAEGLLSMKGKRRHWAELLPENTGVSSRKINCIQIDGLGHLWVGSDEGLNIYDGKIIGSTATISIQFLMVLSMICSSQRTARNILLPIQVLSLLLKVKFLTTPMAHGLCIQQ